MNDLTTTEQASLERHEKVIEKGLASFYEVGSALLTIRDSKLYRGTHRTFESYCKDRWGMTDRHARRLMGSAAVVENIKTGPIGPVLPTTESQIRSLVKLPPEQQREAWRQANACCPGGNVPAAVVSQTVKGMMAEEKPKPAPQPQEPSDAMAFATIAISQLERIHPKDPKRSEALVKVERWIQQHK